MSYEITVCQAPLLDEGVGTKVDAKLLIGRLL